MHTVGVIFAKELKDTIRDRRAMAMMVLFPLLLMPAMVSVVIYLQNKIEQQGHPAVLRVGLVTHGDLKSRRFSSRDGR